MKLINQTERLIDFFLERLMPYLMNRMPAVAATWHWRVSLEKQPVNPSHEIWRSLPR